MEKKNSLHQLLQRNILNKLKRNNMKQTAVELLEEQLNAIRFDVDKNVLTFIDKSIKESKEIEKQQLTAEQIAKEHFRKQRDEGLLESNETIKKLIDALCSIATGEIVGNEKNYKDTVLIMRQIANEALETVKKIKD